MKDERAEIEALVRKVVTRTLGRGVGRVDRKRPLLDEATLRETPIGSTLTLSAGTLITPLAREVAQERHITLEIASAAGPAGDPPQGKLGGRRVAIGSDHGGYEMKEALKAMLAADYEVVDVGTHSKTPVDYPDIATAVARMVAGGGAWRGIILDGAGIGSCMAANKVAGARAAMCYDQATAVNSREHNNANVLTLGAGLIGPNLAKQIVQTWLSTEFGGGRHAARVAKIDALDSRRMEFAPTASAAATPAGDVEQAKPAKAPPASAY
jgi:ribose 5-phosphate isomerase B